MRHVVELRNITLRYGRTDVPAVANLSLELKQGEVLALLGPSGCGKSTTLRLIAGLERPDNGEIWLNGACVASPTIHVPAERRGLGVVFQDYALFPHMTALENVAFGLHAIPARERTSQAHASLALVGLDTLASRYPHQLSGGQQQRVALARALAPRPPLVLLDEPFSNLDAALRTQMRDELREILARAQTTAIFVTHDQAEALALGDRIALLRAGRLEQFGSPDDLFQRPRTRFVATFMGQADFLPARVLENGLQTELGRLSQSAPLAKDAAVEVMVRYDDVSLCADAVGNGYVVGRVYEGQTYTYVVELASGVQVRCKTSHVQRHERGERVRVTLLNDHPLTCFCGEHSVNDN